MRPPRTPVTVSVHGPGPLGGPDLFAVRFWDRRIGRSNFATFTTAAAALAAADRYAEAHHGYIVVEEGVEVTP